MTSQSAATLRSRYVEQTASELEENHRRQQELTEQIAVLKQEEALLREILNLAERYGGFADTSRLPEQLQGESVAAKTQQATAESLPQGPASASAQAGGSGRAGTKGKSRQPLLGELLADLLRTHDQPRLARELRDELLEKHPDRDPTPQVVRNTLESLVAKGRIQRHRQQRSVLYSLVESGRPENTAAADS
ncbi:hypothetical protein C6Y14_12130 [Streptomyces dioscori]|uniref:Uncharacterized protein n=1 Tax=Streptomyces dioscori TaxID=2109333 RepID=A0A2P8Q9J5_9ACTN|nr:hypothetical protein [Streptomyces dioscori]PSM42931.1 hypothetical protein C6Y14_12130 [Streptomyces dioscori]